MKRRERREGAKWCDKKREETIRKRSYASRGMQTKSSRRNISPEEHGEWDLGRNINIFIERKTCLFLLV